MTKDLVVSACVYLHYHYLLLPIYVALIVNFFLVKPCTFIVFFYSQREHKHGGRSSVVKPFRTVNRVHESRHFSTRNGDH
jgi:hypothetical protein